MGEGSFGRSLESAEVQALWSHAVDPYFNVEMGLRQDIRPDPQRTFAVVRIVGLAPYWFELDGQLFLSNKGELSARIEASYDQRITQKVILQPRFEIDAAAQATRALATGAGFTNIELGARLRYEIVKEFAPYVGIN